VKDQMLSPVDEICIVDVQDCTKSSVLLKRLPNTPRPLLVGITVADAGNAFVIMGGSAVCFSFGTFWNRGCFTIHITEGKYDSRSAASASETPKRPWCYMRTIVAVPPVETFEVSRPISTANLHPVSIPRVRIASNEHFGRLIQAGQPMILEKSDIGACTLKWTHKYLKEKVGIDREVSFANEKHAYRMSY
jgi:tRNA wybutosine-synthesizing protein 4